MCGMYPEGYTLYTLFAIVFLLKQHSTIKFLEGGREFTSQLLFFVIDSYHYKKT
jgi:hypothetical protein